MTSRPLGEFQFKNCRLAPVWMAALAVIYDSRILGFAGKLKGVDHLITPLATLGGLILKYGNF